MAKRKRSRPQSSGRAGTKPQRGPGAELKEPLPRVAPAEPGGPNRLARKEEARRQREALRKKMARRRRYRIVGAVLAVTLVAGGITAYALTRPDSAEAAGCSTVETVGAYPEEDRRHITSPINAPGLSTYPSVPPTSGPHAGTPLRSGVYEQPPEIYAAIHSLEHGAVIVWYRPGLSSSDLQEIKDFYRTQAAGDHVIVAPYRYPDQGEAGQLPQGQDVVLVAWHRLTTCEQANLDVVNEFVADYRTPTGVQNPVGYQGDAPEPGNAI
jgi:Protein of unknown function (DUF3105)